MTHANPSHTEPAAPFTPEMIADFRRDDKAAAAAIVCLMSGIFALGLVLYLCVCLWIG